MGAPEIDPLPPEDDDRERERRMRRVWTLVQAGGMVFLVVAMLGLVPAILGARFPALASRATVAVLVLAPAIAVTLLVVAALRLRR
jgi:hypothetical protein